MILSHKRRFIFFAAGKTGTTSIESCLGDYDELPPFSREDHEKYDKHMPPAVFRARVSPAIWNGYYKFAFVRNPWDWLVSAAFFTRKRNWFSTQLTRREILKLARALPMRGITWAEYRTQFAFLTDAQGKLCVDFVGQYEHLQADFDHVCRQAGLPLRKLPALNTTMHRHYSAYYTDETSRLVAELYREDIEAFGYRFVRVARPPGFWEMIRRGLPWRKGPEGAHS